MEAGEKERAILKLGPILVAPGETSYSQLMYLQATVFRTQYSVRAVGLEAFKIVTS